MDDEVGPGETANVQFLNWVEFPSGKVFALGDVAFRANRLVDLERPPTPDGMLIESLIVGNVESLIDPVPLAAFAPVSFMGTICLPTKAVGQEIVARVRNAGAVKQKFALRLKGNVVR